jgi:hypothetical protein
VKKRRLALLTLYAGLAAVPLAAFASGAMDTKLVPSSLPEEWAYRILWGSMYAIYSPLAVACPARFGEFPHIWPRVFFIWPVVLSLLVYREFRRQYKKQDSYGPRNEKD